MEKSNGWALKEVVAGFIKAASFKFTITYLLPLIGSVLTVLIGYASGSSLFWIWLGMLGAFFFIAGGLVTFNEWMYIQRVEDKLIFDAAIVGRDVNDKGLIVGIRLINRARFSIAFEVTDMRTRIGTTVPSKLHQKGKVITIPPEGNGWYYDNSIQVGDLPKSGVVEGEVEYRIVYGKPGCLKYNLSGKKFVVISTNDAGVPMLAFGLDVK